MWHYIMSRSSDVAERLRGASCHSIGLLVQNRDFAYTAPAFDAPVRGRHRNNGITLGVKKPE